MASRVQQIIGTGVLLLATASCWQPAFGEDSQATEIPQPGLRRTTLAEYKSQLAGLPGLLGACRASAQACDPDKVGSDDRVTEAGFNAHWGWLREVLVKAKDKDQDPNGRNTLLDAASIRLIETESEAGLPLTPANALPPDSPAGSPAAHAEDAAVPFARARKAADRILEGAEFRKVTKSSFWEDLLARVGDWLDRMFGGVSSLGQHHRWLGPVVEWGFLALALVGLLVWVQRTMRRQGLAIRFEGSGAMASWQETSRNWAALAQAAAEKGEWREAVHALYWASVTELEGRRVWRQNQARTPREYLRLLQKNAPQYNALRQLTQTLERIWYGLGRAERVDYDQALKLYEELRVA